MCGRKLSLRSWKWFTVVKNQKRCFHCHPPKKLQAARNKKCFFHGGKSLSCVGAKRNLSNPAGLIEFCFCDYNLNASKITPKGFMRQLQYYPVGSNQIIGVHVNTGSSGGKEKGRDAEGGVEAEQQQRGEAEQRCRHRFPQSEMKAGVRWFLSALPGSAGVVSSPSGGTTAEKPGSTRLFSSTVLCSPLPSFCVVAPARYHFCWCTSSFPLVPRLPLL